MSRQVWTTQPPFRKLRLSSVTKKWNSPTTFQAAKVVECSEYPPRQAEGETGNEERIETTVKLNLAMHQPKNLF
jgi:hypothetical protein